MEFLFSPIGWLMNACYQLTNNYAVAIIVFTLLTKVIFLPLSVWVHKNSIKLVKLQPSINRIKAIYYGDSERIAEESALVFKKERYSPLYDLIPLFIQIFLLIGVIQVLYNPLTYLLQLAPEDISLLVSKAAEITGLNQEAASAQITVLSAMQNPQFMQDFLSVPIANIADILSEVQTINTGFLVFDLASIPFDILGITLLVPLAAGLSSLLLSFAQNKSNVLQSEQSKFTKYATAFISVGLSLYLGLFVPAGVALYWVVGNLYGVFILTVLNLLISPKKYIDYEDLEASRAELNAIKSVGVKKKKWYQRDEHAKREKADYKRFFSVLNKKLVFYSEGSGFYKYFKGMIENILSNSNIVIHYITRDANDDIFQKAKENPRIRAYYIGDNKLITLMMKMDAEIVVMTTPDIENFHIKRSYIKKDIEYIFTEHGFGSTNLFYKKNALAHFDTVFCVGPYQVEELRAQEKYYHTKEKKLVEAGYGLLDDMMASYASSNKIKNNKPTILIAPSWQKDNIMDLCLDEVLANLLNKGYKVTVRPHPQYIRLFSAKIEAVFAKYREKLSDDFAIETDFSSNTSVYNCDILITDWSAIAYEFGFTTNKPCIFIDTPMKVMNPSWEDIDVEPIDFTLRKTIGSSIALDKLDTLAATIDTIIKNNDDVMEQIDKCKHENIFNIGKSSEVCAQYILNTLVEKQKTKSKQ